MQPWMPQPGPQSFAIQKHLITELFFGGAVGGGKSDFLLGDFAQDIPQEWGKYCRGILFRRTYGELEDLIARSHEIYPPWFGLNATKAWSASDKTWTWPNGATLKMRYLEHSTDWQRYWGHAYCVAVGTPIVMADGAAKAIEDIKPQEFVATLEGPRRVKATVSPYYAPCVLATVYDGENRIVGRQVHPLWHSVLTTSGLRSIAESISSVFGGKLRNDPLFLGASFSVAAFREFQPYEDPGLSGWCAYSRDDRSGDTNSLQRRQGSPQLGRMSFPAVLHARTVQSIRQREEISDAPSIECRSLGRFSEPYHSPILQQIRKQSDRQPASGRAQSIQASADLLSTNAQSYARRGTGEALGYRRDYPTDARCRDGFSLLWSESDRYDIPQQGDVAGQRHGKLLDVSGTIPTHSRLPQLWWEHPYTGEARHLQEDVQVGRVELEPCGDHLVSDLSVEGANSYLSASTGLVNTNTWIGWDELPSWPDLNAYFKMMARLRSAHPVPNKRIRSTGNPGGPGHGAVKAYFGIDRFPNGGVVIEDKESKTTRIFVKSKVQDNKIMLGNDPGYIDRLKGLGSDALVQAWLEGDWNVVAGAFFDCWDVAKHVIRPFEVPAHWTRFGSFDWGSAKPFSYGLWAVSDGTPLRDGRIYPAGALIRYREWYGNVKPDAETNKSYNPNTGLKLTAEQIATGIHHIETGDKMNYRVADPACFSQDGGPSKAETMAKAGIIFQPADHARIAGWDQVRDRLNGDGEAPMMYVFSTCTDFIRTFPALQHDEQKPEDVDTQGEDHIGDEVRYACMSRPFMKTNPAPQEMRGLQQMTMNELWKHGRARDRAANSRI